MDEVEDADERAGDSRKPKRVPWNTIELTLEAQAEARRLYEKTPQTGRGIAIMLGISHTSLKTYARREGWTKCRRPPVDLTPAAKLSVKLARAELGDAGTASLSLPRVAVGRVGSPSVSEVSRGGGRLYKVQIRPRTLKRRGPPPPTPPHHSLRSRGEGRRGRSRGEVKKSKRSRGEGSALALRFCRQNPSRSRPPSARRWRTRSRRWQTSNPIASARSKTAGAPPPTRITRTRSAISPTRSNACSRCRPPRSKGKMMTPISTPAVTRLRSGLKASSRNGWTRRMLDALSEADFAALEGDFPILAHIHQDPPAASNSGGDWTTWLVLGGRGAGKTRLGAEWVRALCTAARLMRTGRTARSRWSARPSTTCAR